MIKRIRKGNKNPETCKHETYATDLTENFDEDSGTGIEVHCFDCGLRWEE